MSSTLMAVLGCGVIAVLYGVVTASRVMAADAGTPRLLDGAAIATGGVAVAAGNLRADEERMARFREASQGLGP